jgi:type IV secretion system protein TrbL
MKASYASGKAGTPNDANAASATGGPPAWATTMRQRQTMSQGASITAHTLKGGDSHASGSGPDITDKS